jgi:hypothetical protein
MQHCFFFGRGSASTFVRDARPDIVCGKRGRIIPDIHKPLPAPPPLPAMAQPPAWWTANMESDRNTASHGCLMPESNCVECKMRCPLALRLCQTCGRFDSKLGRVGVCDDSHCTVEAEYSCTKWEARK